MKRYVVLEDRIPYDWDDYDLWGVVAYDRETDSIVKKTYGHGQYDWSGEDGCVSLDECDLQEQLKIKACLCRKYANVQKFVYNAPTGGEYRIPVEVVRGRKMKGHRGTLLRIYKDVNTYMKRQYPYGDWTTLMALVKFEDLDEPMSIKAEYLQAADVEEVNAVLLERMIGCDDITIRRLAHIGAYEMSYSHCDSVSAMLEPLKAMFTVMPL